MTLEAMVSSIIWPCEQMSRIPVAPPTVGVAPWAGAAGAVLVGSSFVVGVD